jgi:DNA-binding MarR family transcriptional regulator
MLCFIPKGVTMQDDDRSPNDFEAQLSESTGFLLAVIGQESRRRFMAQVSRWSIGWPHQSVLGALLGLGDDGAPSQKQLSEYVRVDPRNLGVILDTLEAAHLIERVANPRDRRSYRIRLTESGAGLAREIQAAGAKLESDFLAGLTEIEQRTLHQLLLKLHQGTRFDPPHG